MNRRRLAGRIVLTLLGCLMAVSAFQHWIGSDDLRTHYANSVLGAGGLFAIAVAQTVAALGLLWPRTQRWAGFGLAAVMAVAALTHMLPSGSGNALLPLVIGAAAVAGAALVPSLTATTTDRPR